MTLEPLYRWQSMIPPRGLWRRKARFALARIVESYINTHASVDDDELMGLVRTAYPFGPRENHPYRAWREECNLLKQHLRMGPRPAPSAEELAVLMVARDLVEEGRTAQAEALVEEQAPNRHNKVCPTCSANVGEPCWDFDAPSSGTEVIPHAIVPHQARLDIVDPPPNESDFGDLHA